MTWRLRLLLGAIILAAVASAIASAVPFNETRDGLRNLGDPYTFNLSIDFGRDFARYHVVAYDYRILGPTIRVYSTSWGQDLNVSAPSGMEYLAVWVRTWTEGSSSWGYPAGSFYLFDRGTMVPADPVLLDDRPKTTDSTYFPPADIEETYHCIDDKNGVLPAERYGYTGGWSWSEMDPGLSNRWDGYILYEIPAGEDPADLQVAGSFPTGTPFWTLSGNITYRSIEEDTVLAAIARVQDEIRAGLRISDKAIRTVA